MYFIELSNGRYEISQVFKAALENSNFKEQVQELCCLWFETV